MSVFTRISTLGRQEQLLGNSFVNQNRLFDVQRQVSTGKVSPDYKGISRDVLKLNSAKTINENKDQFIRNIDFAELRGRRNEFAINAIKENVDTLRTATITAMGSGEPADFIPQVQANFESVISVLQTTENGKYIFSGSATDTPPWPLDFNFPGDFLPSNSTHNDVLLHDAANPGTVTNVAFDATSATTGTITLTGGGWGTDIRVGSRLDLSGNADGNETYKITDYNPGANQITVELVDTANGTIFSDNATVASNVPTFRQFATSESIVKENLIQNTDALRVEADDGQFLEYGLSASELVENFLTVIGEIIQYDNQQHPNVPRVDAGTLTTGNFAANNGAVTGIPFTGQDFNPSDQINFSFTTTQRDFLEGKLPQVVEALDDTAVAATRNGLMMQEAQRITDRHEDDQVFMSEFISQIEDVDMAEALSDLQLSETALQASFQALARVSSLNLMDFI